MFALPGYQVQVETRERERERRLRWVEHGIIVEKERKGEPETSNSGSKLKTPHTCPWHITDYQPFNRVSWSTTELLRTRPYCSANIVTVVRLGVVTRADCPVHTVTVALKIGLPELSVLWITSFSFSWRGRRSDKPIHLKLKSIQIKCVWRDER